MRLSVLTAPLLSFAIAAQADTLNFLQLPNVNGEVTYSGYEKWIDVNEFNWKVTADTSFIKGGGSSVAKPIPGDFQWTQGMEPSANALFAKIATGNAFDSATMHVIKPGPTNAKPPKPLLSFGATELFMTQVELNSFDSVTASGAFKIMKLEIDPQVKNSPATQVEWNIASAVAKGTESIAPSPKNSTPTLIGSDVAAFLRLDQNIAGMSAAAGYENWIEIDDLGFSVTAEVSFTKGTGAAVGKPQPGSLTWVQAIDNTLPVTLLKILTGQSLTEPVIELVKNVGGTPVTFAQIALKNAYFTEISLANETVSQSVVFEELIQTFFSFDQNGNRTGGTTISWNIPLNKSSVGAANPVSSARGFGPGLLLGKAQGSTDSPREAPAPVPLPATWGLFLAASAVLGIKRRRAA